ncbi:hypothetical protein [Cupriavidus sp. AU9028]|uniref:hypothetical protein n=1 Tax=Cupriavidus sp. AU9028 TaxID=2871157 RepID=UPI001C98918A|nr:hypothetical protein [Cupriavidus sp. AU9028]MBY4898714.1 hypothetical protein [Cupriavidus sp. AU9028]
MAPIFAMGERKATLTVWYDERQMPPAESSPLTEDWKTEIRRLAETGFHDDCWLVEFEPYVAYDARDATDVDVDMDIRVIDYRWSLGLAPFGRRFSSRPVADTRP